MNHKYGATTAAAATLLFLLAGCGVQIPADPDGTLDAVRNATLHAGASPNPGFIQIDDETVSGPEADVIEAFAETLGARVEWTVGSEEALVRGLESGTLDIVRLALLTNSLV